MPLIDVSELVEGFDRPSGFEINPVARAAENEVVSWLWRIGFLRDQAQEAHLRSFELGLYHGMVTPSVDMSALVVGLKWFCWGSLADDQYDNYDWGDRAGRLATVVRDVRAVILGQQVPISNPIVAGFTEFWPELTEGLQDVGRHRMARHFLDYLEAVAVQNGYHARGEVPDAATFLMLRRNTVAMIFQVDVLEVVSGLRIPAALRDSLLFRELAWCFADITAWHNDVYGLEKDLADGQTCNMVRVVAAEERCDLAEAVRRVLDRAKRRQRLFLDLERQLPVCAARLGLPASAAEQAALLTMDLRAYAHANLVWIHRTARYDVALPRIRGTFDDMLTAGPTP